MVAKFHEKCKMATKTLQDLKEGSEAKSSPGLFAVEFVDDNPLKSDQFNLEDPEALDISDGGDDTRRSKSGCVVKQEMPDDDFEYVILDETAALKRDDSVAGDETEANASDSIIEDVDDLYVVAEYLNSDSETDAMTDRLEADADDPESYNQLQRARLRRVEFDSSTTAAKININHCCKICGAGFAQVSNLTRHLATHTNMAPDDVPACGVCNQTFEQ